MKFFSFPCKHRYKAQSATQACQICKNWKWGNEAKLAANTRGLPPLTGITLDGDGLLQELLGYVVRDRLVRGLDLIKQGLLEEGPGMIPELQHVWSELVSFIDGMVAEETSAPRWRSWHRVRFFHLAYVWSTFAMTGESEWQEISARALTTKVLDKQRLGTTLVHLYPYMGGYSQSSAGVLLHRLNDWYSKFLLSDGYKEQLTEKLGLTDKVGQWKVIQ